MTGRKRKFNSQLAVLLHALAIDHEWRSLEEWSDKTGISLISIGAQLRNLRKAQHGAYVIERRRLNGSYQYRLGE